MVIVDVGDDNLFIVLILIPIFIISLRYSGVQLGIFEGRGLTHKKARLKLFTEDAAWNYFFRIRNGRTFTGIFLILLLSTLMLLIRRSITECRIRAL